MSVCHLRGRSEDPLQDQGSHRAESLGEQLPSQLELAALVAGHRLTTATSQPAAGGNGQPGSPGSGGFFAVGELWP